MDKSHFLNKINFLFLPNVVKEIFLGSKPSDFKLVFYDEREMLIIKARWGQPIKSVQGNHETSENWVIVKWLLLGKCILTSVKYIHI